MNILQLLAAHFYYNDNDASLNAFTTSFQVTDDGCTVSSSYWSILPTQFPINRRIINTFKGNNG